MTTICWDGKTLAADTCALISGIRASFPRKLRRFKDGSIAGFAGDIEPALMALDWLDDGGVDPAAAPDLKAGGEIMVVTRDREIILYNSKRLVPVTIEERLYAMGSGGEIALGAMMHGATALQAVRYAIERDPSSGFNVVWLTHT